ncbi:MAG: hypothetical protein ACLPX7_20205 [Xanthobacteraceae bacterium]
MTTFARQKGFCGAALLWLAVAAFSVAAVGHSLAEDAQTPSGGTSAVQAPAAPAPPNPPTAAVPRMPPQPSAPAKPGFFQEVGRWWDGSIGYFRDKIKAAPGTFEDIGKKSGDAAKGAAAATGEGMKKTFDVSKDAATAIGRLPNTRVVEVRERCATAANGAPDCAAAATNVCRSKGFNGGQPLDSRTDEVCPQTALRSSKPSVKSECPLETVVLRVVCQ